MAAPVDASRATTNSTVSGLTHSLNLPGSIASGDILVAAVRCPAATTIAWPAGWTEVEQSNADSSDDETSIAFRIADGTEGATITITLGTSRILVGIAYRITGGAGANSIAFIASVVGSASQPNSPPSGLLTGSGKDFLALSIGGCDGARTLTSGPSGYSNATVQASTATGTSGSTVYGASKQVTGGTSEDPGAWTLGATSIWTAWTVLVSDSAWPMHLSQEAAEVALVPSTIRARLTQEAAEVAVLPSAPRARLTQGAAEVVVLPSAPRARATQLSVEVAVQVALPKARLSAMAAEVVVRVSREHVQVLIID